MSTVVSYNATEQVSLDLTSGLFSIQDVDHSGGVMRLTLSVGEGILNATVGNSGVTVLSGNGTATIVIEGTLASLQSLTTELSTGTCLTSINRTTAVGFNRLDDHGQ